jgi:hypothetical protein
MEELEQGIVFRLASIKDTFPPDAPRLHVTHFELSERDKALPEPLLSVFESKTTIEQAKLIRGVDRESAAYGMRAEHVRSVQVRGLPSPRVLKDPLPPPLCDLPGADGHCGISGLCRQPGESKQLYKELRVRLADLTFPYRDGMS